MTEADVQTQLARLLAIEEIKQLKARYFRLMDLKRWEEWGQVFSADAVMEVPEADMVNRGRDEIVRNVSAALDGTRTTHHGHMPEIEVTGAGTARGTWAMFDHVEWPKRGDQRVGLNGFGHYVEEYVVEDGQWRIALTRLERLRVEPLA
jgi:ketosteroid isomerase-like protein